MEHWDPLLAGPRGRQVCLQAAIGVERARVGGERLGPLGMADFLLGLNEPSPGWFMSSDGWERPEPTTADDVLRELVAVPLGDPTEADLVELFEEAVSSARYWQEPETRDTVLARPDVVAALEPWARVVAGSAHASWWARPVDLSDQRRLVTPGWREDTRPVAARLAEGHASTLADEAAARRERPIDPSANWSGQWWSAPLGLPSTTGTWPSVHDGEPLAARLTEDASFHAEDARWEPVTPPSGAKVLEITDADGWASLCREHPIDVSAAKRHDWYRCTGRVGAWVIPDWQAVAREWDGVHLPLLAWLELAGRPLPVDEQRASVIAGWSPDETHWFRDL